MTPHDFITKWKTHALTERAAAQEHFIDLCRLFEHKTPQQRRNPFAAELARTTIWIGDIQWSIKNAIYSRPQPILRKLDSIERRDAVLTEDGKEAEWPEADFIIGNPPFLGGKLLPQGARRRLCREAFQSL